MQLVKRVFLVAYQGYHCVAPPMERVELELAAVFAEEAKAKCCSPFF